MMYSGRGMYSLPETVTSRQTPSGLKPYRYLFRVRFVARRQTDRQSSEETVACRKVYGEQVEGVEKGDE